MKILIKTKEGEREEDLRILERNGKLYAYYNGRSYVVKERDNGTKEIIVRAKKKKAIPAKTKKEKTKAVVENKLINEEYLDYIRSLPCLITGSKPVDPHHLTPVKYRQVARNDFTAVPLSRYNHTLIEQIGQTKFESRFDINMWQEAHKLVLNWFLYKKK